MNDNRGILSNPNLAPKATASKGIYRNLYAGQENRAGNVRRQVEGPAQKKLKQFLDGEKKFKAGYGIARPITSAVLQGLSAATFGITGVIDGVWKAGDAIGDTVRENQKRNLTNQANSEQANQMKMAPSTKPYQNIDASSIVGAVASAGSAAMSIGDIASSKVTELGNATHKEVLNRSDISVGGNRDFGYSAPTSGAANGGIINSYRKGSKGIINSYGDGSQTIETKKTDSNFNWDDDSGVTHGEGGPKDDLNHAKLDGGHMIPAENVEKFFASGDAERLGLSRHKKADQNQAGGSNVKISPEEYYVSEERVQLSKTLGIDLNQYSPNATEPIGDGVQASGGWLTNKKLIPGYNPNWRKDERQNTAKLKSEHEEAMSQYNSTNTVYVKPEETDTELSSEDKQARKMSIANEMFGALATAGEAGILAFNATRTFRPVPQESIARRDDLPTKRSTAHEEEMAKIAGRTAYNDAVLSGVDRATAGVGIHAANLQNQSAIADREQTWRLGQEEKNTTKDNEDMTKQMRAIYEGKVNNYNAFTEFQDKKAAAIGTGVSNIRDIGQNTLENEMSIQNSKLGNGILSNVLGGRWTSLVQKYKVPSGYNPNRLVTEMGSMTEDEFAAKMGWPVR